MILFSLPSTNETIPVIRAIGGKEFSYKLGYHLGTVHFKYMILDYLILLYIYVTENQSAVWSLFQMSIFRQKELGGEMFLRLICIFHKLFIFKLARSGRPLRQ